MRTSATAGHEAFRAVLLAFAHPGREFALAPGTGSVEVLASVYESQASVWRSPGCDLEFGRAVGVAEASLLLIGGEDSGGALAAADHGSEELPERAATAVYLGRDGASHLAARLRGPGVEDSVAARLPLSRRDLADRDEACTSFPLGVDLLFLADGKVSALPRTTAIELEG